MLYLLAGGGLLSFNTGFAIWIAISLIAFSELQTKDPAPYTAAERGMDPRIIISGEALP